MKAPSWQLNRRTIMTALAIAALDIARVAGARVTQIMDGTGDGMHGLGAPYGIAADTSGNVYVTGHSSGNVFKILRPPMPTPTATLTPTVSGPGIVLGSAAGNPGDTVSISASVHASNVTPGVAATQNDFIYDSSKIAVLASQACASDDSVACITDADCIAATGDPSDTCIEAPDCEVNAAIRKEATQFTFLPQGCAGAACTGVRALVFSFTSPNRLVQDGAVLYSCHVAIGPETPLGHYPLVVGNVALSFPNPPGGEVCSSYSAVLCRAVDGSVTVAALPTPTPTKTATNSPTPCLGDCNGTGRVTVDELVTIVNIALGNLSASSCQAGDANRRFAPVSPGTPTATARSPSMRS
jgi:hypothetical protein